VTTPPQRTSGIEPLPPLPPLPPLELNHPDTAAPPKRRSLLSWATLLAILSAIGFGIIHGVGSKLVDEVWPHIEMLLF
jgi:hypothetical protein